MNEYQKVIHRFIKKFTKKSETCTDPIEAIKLLGLVEYHQKLFEQYGNLEHVEHIFGAEDDEKTS